MENILCVYAASQTYTSTVFEHLDAFRKYSKSTWSYLDISLIDHNDTRLDLFDVIVVHYSVRLPFGQLSDTGIRKLSNFQGLRVLFIQDEYDNTNLAKKIIGQASFDLVFSVVPDRSMSKIYPAGDFPKTKFVNVLTGYVPDELASQSATQNYPSSRPLVLAYRGRPLPLRYGRLGQEKVIIGQTVKDYCLAHNISCDIEWQEHNRIYGQNWYAFIASAKAMLGSESGSNVFDWDGDLTEVIELFQKASPNVTEKEIYDKIIKKREVDGLMNQISPRIFEMAAAKTAMVLFEGSYSGVLKPGVHYLPLKKDFSNLPVIIAELKNDIKIDAMVDVSYQDIIRSGNYGYRKFVGFVDKEMSERFRALKMRAVDVESSSLIWLNKLAKEPAHSTVPLQFGVVSKYRLVRFCCRVMHAILFRVWQSIPPSYKPFIKKILKKS